MGLAVPGMEFESGDAFLFCSDGLTTMLSDEEIRDTVAADETKDAQAMCQGLVDLANENFSITGGTAPIRTAGIVDRLGRPSETTPCAKPSRARVVHHAAVPAGGSNALFRKIPRR